MASKLLRLLTRRSIFCSPTASSAAGSSPPPPAEGTSAISSNFETDFSQLEPSEAFVATLRPDQKTLLPKVVEELRLFAYMGNYVPEKMSDYDWKRTMELKTITEKVTFWEYVALTQRRQKMKERRRTKFAIRFADDPEEVARYEAGGMGYGPNLHALVQNPFRMKERVRRIEGARVFHSMQIDAPKIAFDLQYMEGYSRRTQMELGSQIQYTISENFQAKRPLQLSFVNSPSGDFTEKWLSNTVGFYNAEQGQTILPDFTSKGIRETFPEDREVVYISRFARDVLDGPLRADVFGICVTMDMQRESLGAARRGRYRAVRLPIHKYVKWVSGPQYLPFPNLLNILRHVYSSGGDWHAAFHKFIAKRHLQPVSDEQRIINAAKRKQKIEAKKELIDVITNATGNS
ncbi:unnamed protein product [Caenorhabditis auriculariae]|uniref:SAM-dependent MTase TRM10-type domain-containing protein n=1 Tax=Caenorhabditis auriculariae TaxID=2777116 RepID=A0A8S1GSZ2_9PELO|nr:unnamed protein product [Caenorhabditis auriculariae]